MNFFWKVVLIFSIFQERFYSFRMKNNVPSMHSNKITKIRDLSDPKLHMSPVRNVKINTMLEACGGSYGIPEVEGSDNQPTLEPLISPFARENSLKATSTALQGELELTVANVVKVLDEVRPYLIEDGGDVSVISIDTTSRSIQLSLLGACSSCSSSTTTMKMGIEKKLREYFPNLGRVTARDPGDNEPRAKTISVESLTKSLEGVMPAISALGGTLVITSVNSDTATVYIDFKGPPKLLRGIEMVLKDNKLVKEVVVN